MGMLGMSNFGIENNGMLTLGMLNLGAASGTLNSGTKDDNKAAGLGGGCVGTLNFGGEGTSVLGMSSFGIKKDGMSGTMMSRTCKKNRVGHHLDILGADAAGDDGVPSTIPHPRPHARPLAGLAHRCCRHRPLPQLRTRLSRRRHCHVKDTIATTTIDRHRHRTAAASEDDDSHFNTSFAAAVDIAAATAITAAVTIAFAAAIAVVLTLSAAITVVVVAAVAATTAAAPATADAAATTPSPLPPLSLSLQPPPTSLHLRRSCRWLVVVSSVAPCLLRHPPSKLVSPPVLRSSTLTTTAIAAVNYCHRHYHSQPPRLPKASGCCLLSTAAMAIIVDCSSGQWRRRR